MLIPDFITRVRRRLNNPLAQSPSPLQIVERGKDEYQNATTRASNTGNAWNVAEFNLATVDNTRRYAIPADNFSKALAVVTVPGSTSIYGERGLEFTQLEQLPNEWAWLNNNVGWYGFFQGASGGSASHVAFYRQMSGANGFQNFMEIRPSPVGIENYRVLYQVGDWSASMTSDLTFNLPFGDVSFYFITMVANGLLPYCRWSNDEEADVRQAAKLANGFAFDMQRYEQTFTNFIASLSVGGIVYGTAYADIAGY